MFVLELGRREVKRNFRINKMKLSPSTGRSSGFSNGLAMLGWKEYCHRNRVALPVGTKDTLGTC